MKLHRLRTIFRPVDLLSAAVKSVAVWLSYLVGANITGHFHQESRYFGAMLACIASIIVLQDDVKTTLRLGWLRMLGTFIGAAIAVIYLELFSFTIFGMVLMTFVVTIFCMLVRVPDKGRISIMTLIIVLMISKVSPQINPLVNGLLRFVEGSVGAGIGISLAWLLYRVQKGRKRPKPQ